MRALPRVDLIRVTAEHFDVLHRLMQLYLYDFSVYFCEDDEDGYVGEDGLFDPGIDLMRYVEQPAYEGWLARVEGRWAGFSLVGKRADKARTPREGRNVDEFFVLRCFRRQGVGQEMARRTFDTFRGFWQVMQIDGNESATAFWRRVISAYTGGRYREFEDVGGDGQRQVWQTFDTRRHPPQR